MHRKYSASTVSINAPMIVREFSTKAAALKAAATMPGLVRVATPAGNLVRYVDNRKAA